MTDLCLYEVRDGVAVVTFNRPDRNNGMTGALELAYFARLAEANEDREARAVVVTGAGRSFCPGADLGHRGEPGDEPLPNTKVPTTFPLTIDKPLVAAINGGCAGVGLVQALQCDVRFAATQAKFTTAFARRGLIAEYGVAWLLPRIVGQAAAADLLLSARVFDAAEALRMGLVTAVVDRDEVLDTADRLRPGPRRQRVAGVDGHDQGATAALPDRVARRGGGRQHRAHAPVGRGPGLPRRRRLLPRRTAARLRPPG